MVGRFGRWKLIEIKLLVLLAYLLEVDILDHLYILLVDVGLDSSTDNLVNVFTICYDIYF